MLVTYRYSTINRLLNQSFISYFQRCGAEPFLIGSNSRFTISRSRIRMQHNQILILPAILQLWIATIFNKSKKDSDPDPGRSQKFGRGSSWEVSSGSVTLLVLNSVPVGMLTGAATNVAEVGGQFFCQELHFKIRGISRLWHFASVSALVRLRPSRQPNLHVGCANTQRRENVRVCPALLISWWLAVSMYCMTCLTYASSDLICQRWRVLVWERLSWWWVASWLSGVLLPPANKQPYNGFMHKSPDWRFLRNPDQIKSLQKMKNLANISAVCFY